MTFKNNYAKNQLFLIAALLITLLVTWKIVEQTNQTHLLKQQLQEVRSETELLESYIQNYKLQLEPLNSDYFLDYRIRQQTGYVAEGEKLLILDPDKITQLEEIYQPPQPVVTPTSIHSVSNWQQWQRFLFP